MDNNELTSRNHEKVLGRLLAFSDGVFAIVITLLIFNVAVPDGTTITNLPKTLVDLWPKYMAFGVSFLVIGLYWIVHVRQFRAIKKYTSGLLWLNLLYLMFIVTIPFATSLLSNYYGTISVVIYAITLAGSGFTALLMWLYATRNHKLIDNNFASNQIRPGIILNLIAPVIFVLSIPIAFISTDLANYSWTLIFIIYSVAAKLFKLPKADDDI